MKQHDHSDLYEFQQSVSMQSGGRLIALPLQTPSETSSKSATRREMEDFFLDGYSGAIGWSSGFSPTTLERLMNTT